MQTRSRTLSLVVSITLLLLLQVAVHAADLDYSELFGPYNQITGSNPNAVNPFSITQSTGTILHGVDVSQWQGTINWDNLKSATDFAIMRSSFGAYSVDSQIARNQSEARRVGILMGYYHYAYPEYNDPEPEADHFVNTVGPLMPGEVMCLDFEESTTKDIVDWCLRFLNRVYADTNVRPVLYINYSLETSYDWSKVINGNYGIWLADWDNQANFGTPSTQWPFMAFKQYADNGNVGGLNPVDLDVFNGGRSQFLSYGAPAAPPVLSITSPTSAGSYSTNAGNLAVSGTASDAVAIQSITWSNDRGGSGTCTGTTSWSTNSITLLPGQNVITITANDSFGHQGTASLTVTYDNVSPTVAITGPTTVGAYSTNSPSLSISGNSYDSVGVTGVTWTSSQGGSGVCAGTTSWSANGITLKPGVNVITVTASDAANNSVSATLTATYYDTTSIKWKSGLDMVSIPIIPSGSDPKSVVQFGGNSWFAFEPNQNQYAAYPDTSTWFNPVQSAPGRGFWSGFAGDTSVPTGEVPDQTQPVTIHLLPGWNIIGQPYISPVKWDLQSIKVQVTGQSPATLASSGRIVVPCAWSWDGTSGAYYIVYDSSVMPGVVDTLAPWQGYWIRAYQECDLILPPPGS